MHPKYQHLPGDVRGIIRNKQENEEREKAARAAAEREEQYRQAYRARTAAEEAVWQAYRIRKLSCPTCGGKSAGKGACGNGQSRQGNS